MRDRATTGNHGWETMVAVVRRLIMGLIAAVAVGLLVVAFSGPTQQGSGPAKPEAVQSVFPLPGNLELRQVSIVADLAPGYTGYLAVDGKEVPEDDVQFVDALNTLTLKPGPGSDFANLQAGNHCVTVFFRHIGEPRENSESYGWCFRLH